MDQHDLARYSRIWLAGEPTYRIVRYHFKSGRETIATGLTLDEAREHCSDPATSGEGWFDGFTEE